MHLQYDKKYNPIGRYGCYFISIGAWAEEFLGSTIKEDAVIEVMADCIVEDYMDTKLFIMSPADVFDSYFKQAKSPLRVSYIGWWNQDTGTEFWGNNTSEDIDMEILRVKTPWGYHFKTPGFNPYPELEQGTDINGRRYFKILL